MKHIVCSWKTTLVGVVLIAASIFSVFYMKTVSWGDATVPLVLGVLLMFSPDSIPGKIGMLLSARNNTITAAVNNEEDTDEPASATKPDQPE